MKQSLTNSTAEIFIPDGLEEFEALARITHLGIGAHPDDLEFNAFQGILACYQNDNNWFGGVICTDGAGCSRSGPYATMSDEQMKIIRHKEQNLAAQIGQFGAMIQLDYPSSSVKDPHNTTVRDDLIKLLQATQPRVVYTHNLADKHETHLGVSVATLQALRALPLEQRPEAVYGYEAWRNLDWMPDAEKILQDVSGHENLATALIGVFDSQISGGKRYDLGVVGRRHANASLLESHAVDQAESIAFVMNLTPLIKDDSLDIIAYVNGFIERFRDDVTSQLKKRLNA